MVEQINVLDHGFVRLISWPFEFDSNKLADDMTIVRNARVSYNAVERTGEDSGKDEKLLRYLLKNHHTSPFECINMTFDVKVPIFIARQWHRHRTWSYNEVSARYTELPEQFYLPHPSVIGTQSKTNKQGRDMLSEHKRLDDVVKLMKIHCENAFNNYRLLLDAEIPRELARCVLPVNTYTQFFATVDLHNLMHFLRLRLDSHAQYEFQEYGRAIVELVKPRLPWTMKYFLESI